MTYRKIAALPLRHKLFALQVIYLILSIFCSSRPQPLSVLIYCIGVFTSPILLFSYGSQYMCSRRSWSWEYIPFFLGLLLSTFYVGGMMSGIQSSGNSRLYPTLLAAYLAITLLCALGSLEALSSAGMYSAPTNQPNAKE